jgi:hypothetical protein
MLNPKRTWQLCQGTWAEYRRSENNSQWALRTARYARQLLTNRFLTPGLDKAPRTQAPIGTTGGDAASRSTPPATLLLTGTTIVEIHVGPSKTYRVFCAEKDCTETQFLEKIHGRSA